MSFTQDARCAFPRWRPPLSNLEATPWEDQWVEEVDHPRNPGLKTYHHHRTDHPVYTIQCPSSVFPSHPPKTAQTTVAPVTRSGAQRSTARLVAPRFGIAALHLQLHLLSPTHQPQSQRACAKVNTPSMELSCFDHFGGVLGLALVCHGMAIGLHVFSPLFQPLRRKTGVDRATCFRHVVTEARTQRSFRFRVANERPVHRAFAEHIPEALDSLGPQAWPFYRSGRGSELAGSE